MSDVVTVLDPVAEGRAAYERRAWRDACDLLARVPQTDLPSADLVRLATASYLIGRLPSATAAWELAHRRLRDEGDVRGAVRCAFWLGLALINWGRHAEGGGWIATCAGLLGRLDCPEQGLLAVAPALRELWAGNAEAAHERFRAASEVGERFRDADVVALGRLGQGQALLAMGDAAGGMTLLDEAMVGVTAGEVSPIAAGLVYCTMILACREVFDLPRAREWTAALSQWCSTQQGLQPYRGQCLVHRSEIMQLRGEWTDALEEVAGACRHLADPPGDPVLGMALYQQAELLRLRGEYDRAEPLYRQATGSGHPGQPGLALLRLGQGRVDDAWIMIDRVVHEAGGRVERCRSLAALVEIALAAGRVEAATSGATELRRLADQLDSAYLRAVASSAAGAVLIAQADPRAACAQLRQAWIAWHQLDAPYDAALVRLDLATACRELGDHETADMEIDAARRVLEELGARPALARLARTARGGGTGRREPAAGGLTPREVEVLRLVATGATNREVADALVISDRTVGRHLSNIFAKLNVSSRAAATAYAYENGLSSR